MARTLAKTTYSSPGVVFKVALAQIESYTNLIQAFVECAQYFTDLGYDVLVWSVLSSLGQQRSRTRGGIHPADEQMASGALQVLRKGFSNDTRSWTRHRSFSTSMISSSKATLRTW